MRKLISAVACLVAFLTASVTIVSAEPARKLRVVPPGVKEIPNVVYKHTDSRPLMLDLYLPAATPEMLLPVIVYIHGGSWKRGSRRQCPALGMVPKGYAVASIDYRLSQEAPFPAQIEDCKSAVRWLRANAMKYKLDPDRIGAWGTSAGGHLAALLGTSGDIKELEGDDNLQYSSRVQAVCAVAAPTDLRLGKNGAGSGVSGARPNIGPRAQEALTGLLGGSMESRSALAELASPIRYISKDDPPFLIVHGASDQVVPVELSHRFYEALQKAGVHATLKILPNRGHQSAVTDAVNDAEAFFDTTLKSR